MPGIEPSDRTQEMKAVPSQEQKASEQKGVIGRLVGSLGETGFVQKAMGWYEKASLNIREYFKGRSEVLLEKMDKKIGDIDARMIKMKEDAAKLKAMTYAQEHGFGTSLPADELDRELLTIPGYSADIDALKRKSEALIEKKRLVGEQREKVERAIENTRKRLTQRFLEKRMIAQKFANVLISQLTRLVNEEERIANNIRAIRSEMQPHEEEIARLEREGGVEFRRYRRQYSKMLTENREKIAELRERSKKNALVIAGIRKQTEAQIELLEKINAQLRAIGFQMPDVEQAQEIPTTLEPEESLEVEMADIVSSLPAPTVKIKKVEEPEPEDVADTQKMQALKPRRGRPKKMT